MPPERRTQWLVGELERPPGEWMPTEAEILAMFSFHASLVLAAPHARVHPAHEARRALVRRNGKTVDEASIRAYLGVLD